MLQPYGASAELKSIASRTRCSLHCHCQDVTEAVCCQNPITSGMSIRTRLLASTSIAGAVHREELDHGTRAGEEHVGVEEDYPASNGREPYDRALDRSELCETDVSDDVSDDSADDSEEDDGDADSTNSSPSEQSPETTSLPNRRHVSAIEEAQLSPDGTCIFTSNYDRDFSVYPIDPDILGTESPRSLAPYARFRSSDPIWAFAVNPYFALHDAQTTQVLVSQGYQYISLYNALWDVSNRSPTFEGIDPEPVDISTKLASYKLIDHRTEEVMAPSSLIYTTDGTHFVCGTRNQISIFDLEYTDDPVLNLRTIPSARNKLKDGGRGYKGIVSSLSIAPSTGILAAGTRSRMVALYNAEGSGEQITHFPLPGMVNRNKIHNEYLDGVIGNGVSQLKWSPCGRYLYVAERGSDALLVYDSRNFSFNLGYCVGRNAITKQKLGFDIWAGTGYHEVWAGGVDGNVRVWRDPYLKEGAVEADDLIEVGNAPVSNTLVHPCGSLAIASSAYRKTVGDDENEPGRGKFRGGGLRSRFREWGCLDILGLESCEKEGEGNAGPSD